eukprot:8534853-Ditylum_brightwellii.AAC.1
MALAAINQNFIGSPVLMIPEMVEKVYAGIIRSSAITTRGDIEELRNKERIKRDTLFKQSNQRK